MKLRRHSKKEGWQNVKALLGSRKLKLGQHWSHNLYDDPKRLPFVLSRYKFAAKIIGLGKRVLDIGCGEGLGTWLLKKECGYAKGIDIDKDAISIAKKNWQDPGISFINSDFLSMKEGQYDAIVVFDVIEHILPKNISHFFQKLLQLLAPNGIVVVGTPKHYVKPICIEYSKSRPR